MPLSAAAHSPLFLCRTSNLRPALYHIPLAAHFRLHSSSLLRSVSHPASATPAASESSPFPPSAAAVFGAIRRASSASPVEFTQRVERNGKNGLVLPSPDFQRLCMEQLDLFRSVVDPHADLSKAMLLRHSSWQNNVRMNHLVEQIRGSLSSIRALNKMLAPHVTNNDIAYDIVEDILVQGDNMKDTIQQLQDAVQLTMANIVQHNEDSLKKLQDPITDYPELTKHLLSDVPSRETPNSNAQGINSFLPLGSGKNDIEVPMPPLLLAPVRGHNIRPCSAAEVLRDLAGAAAAVASQQQRSLELTELSHPLLVAIEESALRQALSNLIEGSLLRTRIGDKVEIYGDTAPSGGALIVIDDNGPDMHYMTQMHTLPPFGADMLSSGRVEDNMTWNFVAGLAVAREILESYGCVVRVVSPRKLDAALGAGGTRIELWLPNMNSASD